MPLVGFPVLLNSVLRDFICIYRLCSQVNDDDDDDDDDDDIIIIYRELYLSVFYK